MFIFTISLPVGFQFLSYLFEIGTAQYITVLRMAVRDCLWQYQHVGLLPQPPQAISATIIEEKFQRRQGFLWNFSEIRNMPVWCECNCQFNTQQIVQCWITTWDSSEIMEQALDFRFGPIGPVLDVLTNSNSRYTHSYNIAPRRPRADQFNCIHCSACRNLAVRSDHDFPSHYWKLVQW